MTSSKRFAAYVIIWFLYLLYSQLEVFNSVIYLFTYGLISDYINLIRKIFKFIYIYAISLIPVRKSRFKYIFDIYIYIYILTCLAGAKLCIEFIC